MLGLQTFTERELLDMLVDSTTRYTQLMAANDLLSEEFHKTKKMVQDIQAEIEARHPPSNPSPKNT
jgi:hypothetical protein